MRLSVIIFAFVTILGVAVLAVALSQKSTVRIRAEQSLPADQFSHPIAEAHAAVSPQNSVNQSPTAAASLSSCPGNPNALGIARVVEIDTTGGPGFGFEHFKMHDFLREGEVVLTFDDGPWLSTTPLVMKALAEHCTKAIFFAIGKHATFYPDILKRLVEQGHSVGSHTWSHQDLSKKTVDEAREEIEKGISAVSMATGGKGTPFFRFPALRHPPEMVTYVGQRNVAIFSTDLDSFDFRTRKPAKVVETVMA